MPTIILHTIVHAPKAIVFDLSRSIDLHMVSAKQTHEEAIDGRTSGLIGLEEYVTWKARHFGVVFRLSSKITAFKQEEHFTDEMTAGPFKSFRHQHTFTHHQEGTLMKDTVVFESPFGIAGQFANWLFLTNYMKHFLEQRNQTIKIIAESEEWTSYLN